MAFRAGFLAQPVISLGTAALALLLLVLVLLSVPGPVKSLYWFEIPVNVDGGVQHMRGGVNGWCWSGTSNCTYGALRQVNDSVANGPPDGNPLSSDNKYLSAQFDVSLALTVEMLVPLACYWNLVVLICWVLLTVTTPLGYSIRGTEYISRHLYFNIIEVSVLAMQLFGTILGWMAYGFMNKAYIKLRDENGGIKSGHSMETTAVAATITMITLFIGAYGLHLRIQEAQTVWHDEATHFAGPGGGMREQGISSNMKRQSSMHGQFRASRSFDGDSIRRASSVKGIGGGHPIPYSNSPPAHLAEEIVDERDVQLSGRGEMPRDHRAPQV